MHKSVAGWITHRYAKYAVVAFWIVVVIIAAPMAGKLTDVQDNQTQSWLPSDAESTKALDVSSKFVSENTIPAVILYERKSGLTDADLTKIAADAKTFSGLKDLDGKVTGPIQSKDGQAAQVIVPLDLGKNGWNKAPDVADDINKTAKSDTGGLTVHLTGPLGQASDSSEAFAGIDGKLLYSAALVVIVILLLTYRSPILWLIPIFSVVVALLVAQAVIYQLVQHTSMTVNGQTAGILPVLVFGAGTDYALLLIARYREELRRQPDRHSAMGIALHRAGPAILASGATVAIGMLCLLFAQMNSTKGLGPACAIAIIAGLAVMLTLLPALLVLAGRWVFWPRKPHYGDAEPTARGLWSRVGVRIARRPRTTWAVTSLILGAMCLGIFQLDANGLTNKESYVNEQPSIVGEEALARHFAGGAGNPVVVVAKDAGAAEVSTVLAGTKGIDPDSVTKPQSKDGYTYLEATLTSAADESSAFTTVERVRDRVHAVDGADAKVGGFTAITQDVREASSADNRLIVPIILLVVFLILALLLRALTAPLILVATVVLSFGAALGFSALIFRHVFGFGGADSSFPLFVFVFLVALGIDYNIFLMTRVREEALKFGTRRGALIGLSATGGVITSAGLVLAGTFAALATIPVVFLAELGFAVAFGVLMDTIIVRSVLVTALNLDVGRHMWWPSALGKKEDVDDPDLSEYELDAEQEAAR